MATAEELVHVATAEVGYKAYDDPEPGSKYGRWMAELTGEEWLAGPSKEVWWCNIFVSWCLAQCGQECTGYPSYNTNATLAAGPTLVYREDVVPGDVIIWDWDGDGATDHVGIVSYHKPGAFGFVQCIEGNHNNAVEVVDRSDCWDLVAACIRPPYGEAQAPVTPDTSTDMPPEASEGYVDAMAQRTINGDYGNGDERVWNIYDAVQGAVNAICQGGAVDDEVLESFASDVIDGDYGNGEERVYNVYATVQRKVNELLG